MRSTERTQAADGAFFADVASEQLVSALRTLAAPNLRAQ
jgi:hypothetical protein